MAAALSDIVFARLRCSLGVGLQVEEFHVTAVFEELDQFEVPFANGTGWRRFSNITGEVPEEFSVAVELRSAA